VVAKYGLLFPGQGAQQVGMGADFADRNSAAAELFAEADQVLGMELAKLCFDGPLEQLTRTDIAQPAIYVCSLAALAAINQELGEDIVPGMCAGLSLGEYTALAAAGALSFADGLRLVHLRGTAMQSASELKPSSMSSVLGMERAQLEDLCAQVADNTGLICQVANLNSPGQVVVSGELAALDAFEPMALVAGARRVMRLNVGGAFHSEVMRPAAVELAAALDQTRFEPPTCPVWQNATATAESDPDILRANLIAQLCAPVMWEDSFRAMAAAAGDTPFIELAPGKVLSGLARKIARDAKIISVPSAESLEESLLELH